MIVSITLLLLAGFSFFEIESLLAKEARRNYYRVEAERLYNQAICQLIQDFDAKKIPIDAVKSKDPYILDIHTPNWKAICNFRHKEITENDPEGNAYLKVDLALEHTELGTFSLLRDSDPLTFFLTQGKVHKVDPEDPDTQDPVTSDDEKDLQEEMEQEMEQEMLQEMEQEMQNEQKGEKADEAES